MHAYTPEYVKDFKCIADRCRHSCCEGWAIGVDADTLARHRASDHPISRELIAKLAEDEGDVYIDCPSGRCPFLDSRGLCRIISALGEGYISDICNRHPRFFHRIGDRLEYGIGASCEEAARLILESDGYASFIPTEYDIDDVRSTDFDTLTHREAIYAILSSDVPHKDRLAAILSRYDLTESMLFSDDLSDTLESLELLDDEHINIITARGECPEWAEKYSERFLSYLIFRHLSPSESESDVRTAVALCVLLTRMLEGALAGLDECGIDAAAEVARIISEEIEYCEENTDALRLSLFTQII